MTKLLVPTENSLVNTLARPITTVNLAQLWLQKIQYVLMFKKLIPETHKHLKTNRSLTVPSNLAPDLTLVYSTERCCISESNLNISATAK